MELTDLGSKAFICSSNLTLLSLYHLFAYLVLRDLLYLVFIYRYLISVYVYKEAFEEEWVNPHNY